MMLSRSSFCPPHPVYAAPADPASGGGDPFALPLAMRARLAAAVKAGPIALIDLGSAKTVCAIARIDPKAGDPDGPATPKVLGLGVTRSRGVADGAVVDLAEAGRGVRAAVSEAEREAGLRVFHAVAAAPGGYPRSHAVSAEVAVGGARVSAKDMGRAIAACRPPAEEDGRRVLHAAPVRWTIDGEGGVRAPLGFAGRQLGVDMHILTVAEASVRNLAHCLTQADLEVAGLVSSGYASGLSCLTPEEEEDGAAVVDLGAGSTAVSLFMRGALIFADALRLGGDHLTLDLVRAFGLDRGEAERLKTLEGCAVDMSAGAGPIDLRMIAPRYGDGDRLSRADLAGAIRPRLEEILTLARDRLSQGGFAYLPMRRVVLTGGGAELGGVLETAKSVFGAQVRIGRPGRVAGLPGSASGPAFAALAGLAVFAAAPPPAAAPAPADAGPSRGAIGGLFRWLRDTW